MNTTTSPESTEARIARECREDDAHAEAYAEAHLLGPIASRNFYAAEHRARVNAARIAARINQ
jgi:hypothetical protein